MKKGRAAAKKLRIEKQRADALKNMAKRLDTLEAKINLLLGAMGVDYNVQAYSEWKVSALEDEAQRRGIYDAIEGSGSDGNIVKADLVAALEADDEAGN